MITPLIIKEAVSNSTYIQRQKALGRAMREASKAKEMGWLSISTKKRDAALKKRGITPAIIKGKGIFRAATFGAPAIEDWVFTPKAWKKYNK